MAPYWGDYDMFGCLFGVMNYANFKPIAPERGLPADSSEQIRQELEQFGNTAFSTTWISWREVQAINWEEAAEKADRGVWGVLEQKVVIISPDVLPLPLIETER
jgi:hypothetical protein